jgi:hypothetical protein
MLYIQEGDEAGNWSSSGSHELEINISISPNLISPVGGATNITSEELTWQNIHGASSYELCLSESGIFGEPWVTHEPISWNYYSFSYDHPLTQTYSWSVRAKNQAGEYTKWSRIRYFVAYKSAGSCQDIPETSA